jgi:glycosyltransferase involved in cell wall biosynthesis
MACGCAVATTDCRGNREYAKDGETALVSDPDDFGSLVGNTLRLLSDGELRMRIAFSGRERITQFTWEKKRAATARVRARLSLTAHNVTGSLVAERFPSYHSSSVYQY